MKIICTKYEWADTTEDIDINFHSSVTPTQLETVDLRYFFVKDSMSYKKFSFEGIDNNNTLYGKYSNFSFNCYLLSPFTEGNGVNLIDYFELFESNKFIKWKVNYYDDDFNFLFKGFLYRDGIGIQSIKSGILSFTVLAEDREFKDFFINKTIIDSVSILSFDTGVNGLKYLSLIDCLYKNFPNVSFHPDTVSFIGNYLMAEKPFTYYDTSESFGEVALHLKTGYSAFFLDGISKMVFLDSLLLPMGWIWYFYLGQLVIRERAIEDGDILEIDYQTTQITQSITHNWNQFQVDNVMIEAGGYFDLGNNVTGSGTGGSVFHVPNNRDLTGSSVFTYSNTNRFYNVVRPFKQLRLVNSDQYQFRHDNGHTFRKYINENEYQINLKEIFLIRPGADPVYNYTENVKSYNAKKTLFLKPYINSQWNSGGVDINNARADSGAYYGRGNFFFGAAANSITNSMGYYNGTVADSIFRRYELNGIYYNYERYTQTEHFNKNFKPFMRTNDEVIFGMNIKRVITNPLLLIKIKNYPYADIEGKLFSILDLEFDDVKNKDSNLTLQML